VQSSANPRAELQGQEDDLLPPGRSEEERALPAEAAAGRAETATREAAPVREAPRPARGEHAGEVDWKDLALRLQADMDNYRKRQQRLAQDQIDAERQRLLRALLQVADDLERALAAPAGDVRGLKEGVQLTLRTVMQRLQQEGVERIEAQGQRFDPSWHEAVSAVPHDGSGAAPGTVVKVLEPGYRLGDRLLRPARVIVAV
jgi:molecular chaperone GrpE